MKGRKGRFGAGWFEGLLMAAIAVSSGLQAQHNTSLLVQADSILAPVQPTMWGIFFEDINMGADGGMYAELVKNRSFEFSKPLMGWQIQPAQPEGTVIVLNRVNDAVNPRYLRLQLGQQQAKSVILVNEGFRGMGIKAGEKYQFSCMVKTDAANARAEVRLVDSNGAVLAQASAVLPAASVPWQKIGASLLASSTQAKARMQLVITGTGTVDLDMISLFPQNTWKQRPGGLRQDMVQVLADMKPGFLRFPGGCIVEGFNLDQRYQWKHTIGPVEQRPLLINRWNFEFAHRPAPDYFQTFGLGFFEYFQMAEDIGAEPLPIINCGMACQFNTAELVPLENLDSYVQDALDLIEFANGPSTTTWGKKRAEMGHEAPFNLKYLGIGNENWGPQYLERLQVFVNAIKGKYPYIKIVGSAGTDPSGERFEYLNKGLRAMGIDVIDEHYYRPPEWFLQNANRYDAYPRTGAKILAGEFAAQSHRTASAGNQNNWLTALAEAAFMTGLERNAAVVHMASYAPLFAHTDGWQWTPDLIWVNNLQTAVTPNYYVQQLFSLHKGTHVIKLSSKGLPLAGADSLYASAVVDKASKKLIVKLVNVGATAQQLKVDIKGAKLAANQALHTVLHQPDLQATNPPGAAPMVVPVMQLITFKSSQPQITVAGYSVNAYEFSVR